MKGSPLATLLGRKLNCSFFRVRKLFGARKAVGRNVHTRAFCGLRRQLAVASASPLLQAQGRRAVNATFRSGVFIGLSRVYGDCRHWGHRGRGQKWCAKAAKRGRHSYAAVCFPPL